MTRKDRRAPRRGPKPKAGQEERLARKRERREEARAEREREARRRRRMTRMRRAGLGAVVGLAVVGGGFLLVRSAGRGVSFEGDLRAGGRLASLSLPALEGDATVEYEDVRGKPLVLNFFASWCPNCIAEMPRFQQAYQAVGDRVEFIGVSQSDPVRASIDIVRETGVTYRTAIDRRGELFRAFGGLGMPVTVFIGPDGTISEVFTGELSAEALAGMIVEYFGVSYQV
jgi:peroxiredoxin